MSALDIFLIGLLLLAVLVIVYLACKVSDCSGLYAQYKGYYEIARTRADANWDTTIEARAERNQARIERDAYKDGLCRITRMQTKQMANIGSRMVAEAHRALKEGLEA